MPFLLSLGLLYTFLKSGKEAAIAAAFPGAIFPLLFHLRRQSHTIELCYRKKDGKKEGMEEASKQASKQASKRQLSFLNLLLQLFHGEERKEASYFG